MKIKFPFLFFPAFVFLIGSLPTGFAGMTNAFVIRIKKEYENDKGLLEHELTHVAGFYKYMLVSFIAIVVALFLYDPTYIKIGDQFMVDNLLVILAFSFSTYALLYKFYDKFRFTEECKCYQVQCRYYDVDRSEMFAGFVATKYNLKYSKEEVLLLIRDGDYGQYTRALKKFSV